MIYLVIGLGITVIAPWMFEPENKTQSTGFWCVSDMSFCPDFVGAKLSKHAVFNSDDQF